MVPGHFRSPVLPPQPNPPDLNNNIMSVNLRWDTPGLKWDSGATWDGTQPVNNPNIKHMYTKAIIAFRPYRNNDLSPAAHTVHDQMTLNAATFAAPPVTMATLLTQCTDYDEKLAAKASRSMADTLAFTVARATLELTLRRLGSYVNLTANGDPVIVMQSGFPSYITARTVNDNPPPAPTEVRMVQGLVSGAFQLRFKPGRTPSMNEVAVNVGDPMVENDWQDRGTYTGGRVDLDGFTPGTLVWARARTLGLKGVVGDWSDPAQLRVV